MLFLSLVIYACLAVDINSKRQLEIGFSLIFLKVSGIIDNHSKKLPIEYS